MIARGAPNLAKRDFRICKRLGLIGGGASLQPILTVVNGHANHIVPREKGTGHKVNAQIVKRFPQSLDGVLGIASQLRSFSLALARVTYAYSSGEVSLLRFNSGDSSIEDLQFCFTSLISSWFPVKQSLDLELGVGWFIFKNASRMRMYRRDHISGSTSGEVYHLELEREKHCFLDVEVTFSNRVKFPDEENQESNFDLETIGVDRRISLVELAVADWDTYLGYCHGKCCLLVVDSFDKNDSPIRLTTLFNRFSRGQKLGLVLSVENQMPEPCLEFQQLR
ncbi:hypothetical protein Tco_0380999 [Tanacetum coccineum]